MTSKKGIELLIIFYAVGLAGLAIPFTRPWFGYLIPVNLLVSAGILFYFYQPRNTRFYLAAGIVFLLGFFIEAIGTNTGLVFGHYNYGTTLGPKLLQTPLVIGINWLMLIYCVYVIIKKIKLPWLINSIIGSLAMVLFDFVMEPVAIKLGMWHWQQESIPLNNYLAWFMISYIMLIILYMFKINKSNKVAVWLLGLQFLFFITLRIIFSMID